MAGCDIVHEIKFSKSQALSSVFAILVLFEPLSKMVRQGMEFSEYYWFAIVFVIGSCAFWNIIRVTFMMMAGTPAIVITKNDITITKKGYTIEWKDIEEMNLVVTSGKGRSYNLIITVKDPWKYIGAIRDPITRYYCWYGIDYFYRPFTVDLSMLEGDNYDVYNTIENYYHTYRRLAS